MRTRGFAPKKSSGMGAFHALEQRVLLSGELPIPVLSSDPGAAAKLYLDFDGDPASTWYGTPVPATPAFTLDGDPTTFSDAELAAIRGIWARVAEKYAPLNLDVTTTDPGYNATSDAANNKVVLKAVIGGDGAWTGGSFGGISWTNAFFDYHPNTIYIFPPNLSNNLGYISEATSHEAGHGFGLNHQAQWSGSSLVTEYNPGDALRAPVMGLSYYSARGVWWYGPTQFAYNSIQDDLAKLSNLSTNGFGYRPDDRGNTTGTATALSLSGTNLSGSGIIENTSDLDYYSFTVSSAGQVSFTATPGSYVLGQTGSSDGATLDLRLEIRDGANNLIASADTASLGETLTSSLSAGTYYLVVASHGQYGDIGTYNIAGTLPAATTSRQVTSPTNIVASPGQVASTAINIDNAAGVQAFDFTIDYNTALLDLSAADVTKGSLLPGDWSMTVNVNEATGHVIITAYSANPIASGVGELVHLNFHVPAGGSAGRSAVVIGGTLNEDQIQMSAANGQIAVPLTEGITGAPASSPEGTAISLGSTVSGSAGPFTYSWNVTKNGAAYTTGTGANFSFTPNDNATYVVMLAASDGTNSGSDSKTITVTNVAPTAAIVGAPAGGPEGTLISLTSTVTDPGTVDTFTYAWSVTKNGASYLTGSVAGFSFTPDDNGTYVVTLTATDKDGGSGTDSKTITVNNVAPTAAIAGAPPTSPEGAVINLTGSATDPGTLDATFAYAWTVTKDGSNYVTGTGASFGFTPTDNGTYIVTLTATDKDGGAGGDSRTITVNNVAPTVAINGAPAGSPEGTVINLASTVSDPGAMDTLTYAWSVAKNGGNCLTGSAASFSFTPDDNGTYIVTLTVTDKDGGVGTDSKTITATNVGPTPSIAGAPASSPEGTAISLTASATDPGPLDTSFTYAWTVTKGGSNYTAGAGSSFAFTPTDNGTYIVTLTAGDKDGGSGTDSRTITVTNVNPTAAISGAPPSGPEGTAISLAGSATDPGTLDTFTYAWSVTKNGSNFTTGAGASFGFTPDDNGTYVVAVTVTDKDGGTGADTKTITVTNVAPTASIPSAPATSPEGTAISLNCASSDPGVLDTITCAWGVTKNGSNYTTGSGSSFSLTPDDNGTYIVTLTTTDKDGASGTDSKTITITNVAPAASIAGAPASSPEGTVINLTGSATDPGAAEAITFAWTVTKDGGAYTSGTGSSFAFTPTDNGTYIVTLTATDKDSASGSDAKTIVVTNVAPMASISGAPASSPEGTAISLTGAASDPGALDTITYAWNVTKDGSPYLTGSGPSLSFTPTIAGTYVVTLTATDKDAATGTDAKTIAVSNVAPTVSITGAPVSGPEGTPIPLGTQVNHPSTGETFGYAWSVTKNGVAFTSGTSAGFSFTPDDNATYIVSVTVTDQSGATGSDSKMVTVTNVAPTVAISGAPAIGLEGAVISLTSSVTDPGTLDTLTYSWNVTKNGAKFLTGSTSSFAFTPDDNATYVVTLTVTDKDGGAGSDSKTITVTNVSPTASITGAPANSPEGTAISLTGSATDPGSLDSTFNFAWTVTKDGANYMTGTGAGFNFTPTDNGTYIVTLTATDKDGGAGTASKTITVNNVAPTAAITGTPASSPEGTAIGLGSTASDPGSLDTFTYAWNVTKNGANYLSGSAQSFGFTPDDNGTYVVSLSATDKDGGIGTDSKTITVTNVAPTASIAGAPANSPEGTGISLTGSATDPGSLDAPFTYAWAVTKNGSNYTTGAGAGFNFTPDDNGTYVVTLTATDKDGASGTESKTITVTNVNPTATITGAPASSPEGSAISLTGSATDPGTLDTSFTYAWSVTKNGANYTTGTGAGFSFAPDDNAAYVVTLTATDKDGGSGMDSRTITVTNVAPTASISGAPSSSPEGTVISLTGAATDPGSLDTVAYAWSVTKNGSNLTTGTGSSFGFTPDDNGTYIVTLTATDKDGAQGTDSKTITVTNVAPTASIIGAPASSPEGTAINLTAGVIDPGAADTFTYSWQVSASNGEVISAGSAAAFSFTPHDPGTYQVTLTATDKDGASGSDVRTINVTEVTFRVTAFTPTASGFDVTFNRAANASLLNLYNTGDPAANPADVVMSGASTGAVKGTLVWDPATFTAHFVRTRGPLPADAYTVTLASRASGWVDARGGWLDGNSDGTAGGDFVQGFTIDPSAAPVLKVPDFARLGGQTVNVPNTTAGLPITISNGQDISSVTMDLVYDPSLLSVTGASLAAGLPADWSITSNLTIAGVVHVSLGGTTPLSAGARELVRLTAAVPSGAAQGAMEVLRFANISINGGATPAIGDQAVHVVAALGDTTGNGGYSGMDCSLLARVTTTLDTGYAAYPLVDPIIIGDVSGNGSLSGLDAAFVSRRAALLPQPEFPDLPGGGGSGGGAGGLPTGGGDGIASLSVPAEIAVRPGTDITVPVQLSGATGILAVDQVLRYDTSALDLTRSDISASGLPANWSWERMVDDATGTVRITIYDTNPTDFGSVTLANLTFHVPAGTADGPDALTLSGQIDEGRQAASVGSGIVAIDGTPPKITGISYEIASGPQHVGVKFTENVAATLATTQLSLVNTTTGQTIDPSTMQMAFDAATSTAYFTFPGLAGGILPNGDYTLAITPSAIADLAGNALDAASSVLTANFYALAGDSNGDRAVNFIDLVAVAQNYNTASGGTWAIGDFNGDGAVNFIDLVAVAQNYNTILPAPGEAVSSASAEPAPQEAVQVVASSSGSVATLPSEEDAVVPSTDQVGCGSEILSAAVDSSRSSGTPDTVTLNAPRVQNVPVLAANVALVVCEPVQAAPSGPAVDGASISAVGLSKSRAARATLTGVSQKISYGHRREDLPTEAKPLTTRRTASGGLFGAGAASRPKAFTLHSDVRQPAVALPPPLFSVQRIREPATILE